METLSNLIQQNPYLVVIGWAATILGLICAVIIPIIQRKRKQLVMSYSVVNLLNQNVSGLDDLKISYLGVDIEQLTIATIKIKNTGNCIIDYRDIYPGHDLKITRVNNDDGQILYSNIVSQSSDTIECKLKTIDNDVYVAFQTFEKKDSITINAYYSGSTHLECKLEGRIREGKIINSKYDTDEILTIASELTVGSSSLTSIIARSIFKSLFEL